MNSAEVAPLVEQWFAQHNVDGEFMYGLPIESHPIAFGNTDWRATVYTTKPRALAAAMQCYASRVSTTVIGCYGLPDRGELSSLVPINIRRQLAFLGDLDPVDLLVFAWLRAVLPQYDVKYVGVSDNLLTQFLVRPLEIVTLVQSQSEMASHSILTKVFPEYSQIIGSDCASVLRDGRKIELEVIIGKKVAAIQWATLFGL